jgi:hypothetical protein
MLPKVGCYICYVLQLWGDGMCFGLERNFDVPWMSFNVC